MWVLKWITRFMENIFHLNEYNDNVWWIGFACLHSNDWCPLGDCFEGGGYRDIPYVTSEIESLANQLKEKESEKV